MRKWAIKRRLSRFGGGLALFLGLWGCGDGVSLDRAEVVYFSPFRQEAVQVKKVEDRLPPLTEQERAQTDELIAEFHRQAPRAAQRPAQGDELDAIEQIFLVSGRYLELVQIYEENVKNFGIDSWMAPELAWAYMQIGDEIRAKELIGKLKEERGDEAQVWILAGTYDLSEAETSPVAARRAREAFERALELEPEFAGFKGVDAGLLRNQIAELRQREGAPAAQVREDRVGEQGQQEPAAVVEVAPEEEVVDEPQEVEEVEEAPKEVPPQAAPVQRSPQEIQEAAHFVVLGQAAMQRGESGYVEAQRYFQQALALEGDNLDAALGLLLLAGRTGAPEAMLRAQVERIAEAPHVSARQVYDLALFVRRRLNDQALAISLLKQVQELDPSFAERVGVDAYLP